MKKMPDFKRGDSYQATCTYRGDGTNPSSIAGFTIAAQLRTPSGGLIADMVVTPLTQSGATLGKFTLTKDKIYTAKWEPSDSYEMDIEITDVAGIKRSCETFNQPVVKDVTR